MPEASYKPDHEFKTCLVNGNRPLKAAFVLDILLRLFLIFIAMVRTVFVWKHADHRPVKEEKNYNES